MRKKIIKAISLVITLVVLTTSLIACRKTEDNGIAKSTGNVQNNSNGNTDDIENAEGTSNIKNNEHITAKEAFEQEGIWFHSDEAMITKDEVIDYILVFDGKENVTHYKMTDYRDYLSYEQTSYKYGDLRGLSDKDIIELAKKQDKALFESAMQELLSYAMDIKNDISYSSDEAYQKSIDEVISKINEMQYREPEACPFTLKIETDGTGNATETETLTYSYTTWTIGMFDSTSDWPSMEQAHSWNGYFEESKEVGLYPAPGNMTVYDMQFNGFGTLAVQVEEGTGGFAFDTPDTEGIEVD